MIAGISFFAGCASPRGTFADDVAFLERHTDVVVLADGDARVAVVPAYQGRVMTSTFAGNGGPSLGWVNRELIASGEIRPHINVFGGEDRFWLGPEGGQFALFFEKGDAFTLDDWQTPPLIDTEPFPLVDWDNGSADFRREATLVNYSGTRFDCVIERTVRLLARAEAEAALGMEVDRAVRLVAYQSLSTLTNTGDAPWTREGGLLSIWILGMYKASPSLTVVVPYRSGSGSERGPIVNDAYFGKVPADRLVIGERVIFFKGDGRYRSKIGVGPSRALPFLGSWDAAAGVLTVVTYTLPEGASEYVNSMWELQEEPFAGDVVNSYNDGPSKPGAESLGAFYELETSSPAAALGPGGSITHLHRTMHFQGPRDSLDKIARRTLGVGLDEIEKAFEGAQP